jgi:RNA polymerase-associated protein CTR9
MACFHYQAERYVRARELFQAALNACVQAASRDESIDTDALVTSISYNLGRTYESEGMLDEAKDVYEGLLKRHADYVDARIRLTYISLRQSPNDAGPKAVKKLFKENEDNVEVRALFGWYKNKSKQRTLNFAEDEEQRLCKHTLQKFDKHDRYSLMGMGNIHLTIARELPRGSEQEKEKRRKAYERAVEFFDKVLQLDPKNAYAAQGIAIALVEDKKDYSAALQIFSKVKETIKDYSVYMNLGHTYCEIKQYIRAIENVSHLKPHLFPLLTTTVRGSALERPTAGPQDSRLSRTHLVPARKARAQHRRVPDSTRLLQAGAQNHPQRPQRTVQRCVCAFPDCNQHS